MWRIAEDGTAKSALQETLEICKRLCEHLASMTGAPSTSTPPTAASDLDRPGQETAPQRTSPRPGNTQISLNRQNSKVLLVCRLEPVHKVGNDPSLCQRPANERKKFISLQPSIHLRPAAGFGGLGRF